MFLLITPLKINKVKKNSFYIKYIKKYYFRPVNEVDLQLPSVPEQEHYYVPEVITRRPELKFEEKIVTLSKEKVNGPISFKKRKGEELKKNVRRRIDD